MFYCFDQNNSGGSFDTDNNLAQFVIVEARNADEAIERAENLGIYFNGAEDNMDCPCCGDRWYPVDDSDGDVEPLLRGEHPAAYRPILTAEGEVYCYVHYLNNVVEEHRFYRNVNEWLTA